MTRMADCRNANTRPRVWSSTSLPTIVYPVTYVPVEAHVAGVTIPMRRIYELNPLTRLVGAYRDVLYDTRFPSVSTMLIIVTAAVFCFALGWAVFARLQRRVAEEV